MRSGTEAGSRLELLAVVSAWERKCFIQFSLEESKVGLLINDLIARGLCKNNYRNKVPLKVMNVHHDKLLI